MKVDQSDGIKLSLFNGIYGGEIPGILLGLID